LKPKKNLRIEIPKTKKGIESKIPIDVSLLSDSLDNLLS
jgi:hypothetical protein